MLIGVVGLNGAGKDTLANYLVSIYGFCHVDIGQEIRDELKRTGRNAVDRNEMVELGNRMRHVYGPDYWCSRAIESMGSRDMIVTSIRNPAEAEKILEHGGVLVEIHAERKTRFERTVLRVKSKNGSHGDVQSFDDFVAREEREMKNADPANQQLLKCIGMAKYQIANDGTEDQLHMQIDALMKRFGFTDRQL